MREVRFTEEQMVAIMREADREPVAVVAKRHGISEQTIYVWRKRFGGSPKTTSRRCSISRIRAEFLIQPDVPFAFGIMTARWSGPSL